MIKDWNFKITAVFILAFSFLSWECSLGHRHPDEKYLSKIVMGYYSSWKKEIFDHKKINYANLTHLAHAFTKPDSEGNLIVDKNYIYPELNKSAHENGVKVIMSIGGWGNCEGFPGMSSTSEKRKKFITQVLRFCQKNNYDGVDIDWEYVSNPTEQKNFVFLSKELSTALKAQNPPLALTMAVPSSHFWGRWINYEEVSDYYDFISFMTYDFHGEWTDHSGHNSPLYSCDNDACGSMSGSFEYALSRQIPKEKLVLGIPFYGRSFDCSGLYQKFQKSKYYGYAQIMELIRSGWTYNWDDCAKVPYVLRPDKKEIASFDDSRSVSLKCKFVKDNNAAGIIIWELSEDYYQGSSTLLRVIGEEFTGNR